MMANFASLQLHGADYRSLGASGMVLAALGLLTATGVAEARQRQPGWKPLFGALGAGVMLWVLTGSDPTTDVGVHFGGFAAGLLVGAGLESGRGLLASRRWVQPLATAFFLISFAVAWFAALSR